MSYPIAKNQRPTFRIPDSAFRNCPQGLTLVEMLVGMAITLVMMAAVVNLFANLGSGVSNRRAAMEMSGQLRLVRARLFNDLAGATCRARPKTAIDSHSDGYIEIVDSIWSDKNPSALLDGNATNGELDYTTSLVPGSNGPVASGEVTDGLALGDYDDILALTVRSDSEPFIGRHKKVHAANPQDWIDETIESNLAEVIWYAVENPADGSLGEPGMRSIYRRVLLIAPWLSPIDLAAIPTTGGDFMAPGSANRFYQRYDISARYEPTTGLWIPNTLADLTKRENRFAHLFDISLFDQGFPHALQLANIRIAPGTDPSPFHPFGEPWFVPDENFDDPERQGDDVMLNDVLAFDVRVFDPDAELLNLNSAGIVVGPSDAGWRHNYNGTPNPIVGKGAYVDLNYGQKYLAYANLIAVSPSPTANSLIVTPFYGPSAQRSQLSFSEEGIYDTWSFHYENDGLDQDDTTRNDNRNDHDSSTGDVDEATNELDDIVPPATVATNGPDDVGERETLPPYDVPLRGIQVKIRIYEPDSRQIREATVTRNFVD